MRASYNAGVVQRGRRTTRRAAGRRRVGGRRTPGDQVVMADLDRPPWGLPMATMLARTFRTVNTFDKFAKTSRAAKDPAIESIACSQAIGETCPPNRVTSRRSQLVKARKNGDQERSSTSKVSSHEPIIVDASRERRSPPDGGQGAALSGRVSARENVPVRGVSTSTAPALPTPPPAVERSRGIVTDTIGRLPAVLVTAASVQHGTAGRGRHRRTSHPPHPARNPTTEDRGIPPTVSGRTAQCRRPAGDTEGAAAVRS